MSFIASNASGTATYVVPLLLGMTARTLIVVLVIAPKNFSD